jgi:hypothetical protein
MKFSIASSLQEAADVWKPTLLLEREPFHSKRIHRRFGRRVQDSTISSNRKFGNERGRRPGDLFMGRSEVPRSPDHPPAGAASQRLDGLRPLGVYLA